MINSGLYDAGLSLEEAFFRKRDAELIEQHRKLDKMERTREAMAEISGIRNPRILDKLIALEVSPDVLASIAVVPLVEVAWADGQVDAKEHQAVLAAADLSGIRKGSVDYALLDAWLNHRPPVQLLDAWVHYIEGLCETMSVQECKTLQSELLGRAKQVAAATGGVLGIAFKISPEERSVLKKMEVAFKKSPSSTK